MKKAIGFLFIGCLAFAGNEFKHNLEYTCLNTAIVENGVKKEVDFVKSLERPFIFKIEEKKLITTNNIVFDYKMEKNDLVSYSNDSFMLLLMKEKELGLVPKKSRGQIQYIFKCKSK